MKDGGPAFPAVYWDRDSAGQYVPRVSEVGMSLRAWFAGRALPGVMQTAVTAGAYMDSKKVAECCYQVADAMLAEGEKERHAQPAS